MGPAEVRQFLTHLAADRSVAAATQNQALSALIFLYREFFEREVEFIEGFERSNRTPRIPVVLTQAEVRTLIQTADPRYQVFLRLLYGTGMRLLEGLRLRVKDLDFGQLPHPAPQPCHPSAREWL